jgi:hypothetical protein
VEALAVLIEELVLAILHEGPLDLVGGLVALGGFDAVADPAHVHLGGRGALAGVEALGIEDDVELAVDFDDIALAERTGDDLHGCSSSILAVLWADPGRFRGAPY